MVAAAEAAVKAARARLLPHFPYEQFPNESRELQVHGTSRERGNGGLHHDVLLGFAVRQGRCIVTMNRDDFLSLA